MPAAEIVDRLSILLLKCERAGDSHLREFFEYARAILLEEDLPGLSTKIAFLRELYMANGEIWDLESDIRSDREAELGLEEVGRRAIQIRGKNRKRISLKNDLSLQLGDHIETKVDHGSSDD
jgi:hypothetical protein